jgi:hypothetical protein
VLAYRAHGCSHARIALADDADRLEFSHAGDST